MVILLDFVKSYATVNIVDSKFRKLKKCHIPKLCRIRLSKVKVTVQGHGVNMPILGTCIRAANGRPHTLQTG